MHRRQFWPLMILVACTNGKDDPVETGESGDDSGDSGTDSETATETGESGDSGETDTGDTATSFAAITTEPTLVEATDVAVSADGRAWVVGFTDDEEAAVFELDLGGGGVRVLHAGAPLVQPTGIALSDDGATLYVSDLASEPGTTNGAVYTLATGGGGLGLLTAGVIDLPGDVAIAHGGSAVYVSGFTSAGAPAVFTVSSAGVVNVAFEGAPLVEPLALAAAPAGDALYVVDALVSAERAAVFAFDLPDFRDSVLASGLNMAFPGGVATDGSFVYSSVTGDPGILQLTPGATTFTVLDTLGLLELPAGLAVTADQLFVTELSALGDADLYALTF